MRLDFAPGSFRLLALGALHRHEPQPFREGRRSEEAMVPGCSMEDFAPLVRDHHAGSADRELVLVIDQHLEGGCGEVRSVARRVAYGYNHTLIPLEYLIARMPYGRNVFPAFVALLGMHDDDHDGHPIRLDGNRLAADGAHEIQAAQAVIHCRFPHVM